MSILKPLPERLRPENFDDFLGQDHLFGKNGILRKMLKSGEMFSAILYGPPGCGKSSVLNLMKKYLKGEIHWISAATHGTSELKKIFKRAEELKKHGVKTYLFIDEIHRLNKNQQTVLVNHVEMGTIVLIGTTTENPSFSVIPALLSRCRVLFFKPLDVEDIQSILQKAIKKDKELSSIQIDEEVLKKIAEVSGGDARIALNTLDIVCQITKSTNKNKITLEDLSLVDKHVFSYTREKHYDLASAFIKSMRGSDPNAALYYMIKMIENGEDPRFIARRMVILASEDIGLADPFALSLAVSAAQAVEFVGLPECVLNLAEAVIYLSLAPKSNSVYESVQKVKETLKKYPQEPVPLFLRNPVTNLMKEKGYGLGYLYPHDFGGFVRMNYLPERLKNSVFYIPKIVGEETKLLKILKKLWPEKYGGGNMVVKELMYKNLKIQIVKGDITKEEVDAIVNAANEYLKHGGGVAGAIVRAGGYEIQKESDDIVREKGPVPTGEAVVTNGGKLPAKYVIHAVGPVWNGGKSNEDEKLRNAVYNSLLRAHELKLESISIPAISTGIFGFPKERAVSIFAKAIREFIDDHPDTSLKFVRICNIDEETTNVFKKNFKI